MIESLSPKQSLALELYNVGQFEPASKVRFLNLVTIVEVLAIREQTAVGVRDLIDKLKQSVKASE